MKSNNSIQNLKHAKNNSSMGLLARDENSDSRTLLNEIQVQENKIKGMTDKIITQDHELNKLRKVEMNV